MRLVLCVLLIAAVSFAAGTILTVSPIPNHNALPMGRG
jgi:hypothetical protein